MKTYVVGYSKHGPKNAPKERIPELIKATNPAYVEVLLNGRWFNVCVDLDSSDTPHLTGLSEKMDKVYLLNKLVFFSDDMTDEDIEFIERQIEEVLDPDFDKLYYAVVGIEDLKWAKG